MLEIDHFKKLIEKRLGPIQDIAPIERGFSNEKKFKLTIGKSDYLLRLSALKSLDSKTTEFELMKKLYAKGVRCNEPIIMFSNEEQESVCAVYSYLSGRDAENNIAGMPEEIQYQIGVDAGRDLKRINLLSRDTKNWKERKWRKHERFVSRYFKQSYRFKNDEKVLRFIEARYDPSEADRDYLQHDDFHPGNIIIKESGYSGVIDSNRYDWGDPLHEFVKLEWFTWPVSKAFACGQVDEYFGGGRLEDDECMQISVYIAMSILSSIIWTLEFHPHTWKNMEIRMQRILDHYEYFERVRPEWAG